MTDNGQYLEYGIIKWDYICLSVIKVLYLMALLIACFLKNRLMKITRSQSKSLDKYIKIMILSGTTTLEFFKKSENAI